MCHFVTLIVPTGDQARIAEVMRRHGRRADPLDNPSVAKALRPGEHQYLTTANHCDCGTVLAAREGGDPEELLAREAARLARKGWSRAKAARAIEDRRRALAKPDIRAPDSIALWAKVLGTLLGELGLPHAGLLVHFYSGSPSDDVFEVRRRNLPACQHFESLASMREDEIAVWVR